MPSGSFNILSPLPFSFVYWHPHHLVSSLASSVHCQYSRIFPVSRLEFLQSDACE